jgi:hypothetical protein
MMSKTKITETEFNTAEQELQHAFNVLLETTPNQTVFKQNVLAQQEEKQNAKDLFGEFARVFTELLVKIRPLLFGSGKIWRRLNILNWIKMGKLLFDFVKALITLIKNRDQVTPIAQLK